MATLFALVDCNNFYASCERVFEPHLEGKAIVVLSNNDGCIVARSNEAKALNIPMGVPLYQVKEIITKHHVVVRSSNYALYGDMSHRVMNVLSRYSPHQEVYSIDESFLDFSGLSNPIQLAKQLRAEVRRLTGIPVCVGMGSSKTQAKLANYCAKKVSPYIQDGVCDLSALEPTVYAQLMKSISVAEVWGIGRRTSQKLAALKIRTVYDLINADSKLIRRQFNVLVERIIHELTGISCVNLEEVLPEKHQIIASRSFGSLVTELEELEGAIANHVHRAVEKLRHQHGTATLLTVFIQTNRFRTQDAQYNPYQTISLVQPCQELAVFQKAANQALHHIFKKGYQYKKAGVMLSGIQSEAISQQDLFAEPSVINSPMMQIMDRINKQYGRGTLRTAGELIGQKWIMKQDLRSPRYTTCWDELKVVE